MKTGFDYTLKVSEKAAKLSWLGAERLATLIKALFSDKNKISGLTNLKRLIQEDKSPAVVPVGKEVLDKFKNLCKKYGVLFTTVSTDNVNKVDVIFDSAKVDIVQRIFQTMGYHPEIETEPVKATLGENSKNFNPLVQSLNGLNQRGELFTQKSTTKPSVVERIEVAKFTLKNPISSKKKESLEK